MPGQAAFFSTPATARLTRTQDSFANHNSDDPSWTASLESPFARLDRDVRSLTEDDDQSIEPSMSNQISSLQYDAPTPVSTKQEASIRPRSEKGKGKESGQPLLRNVLKHNLYSASDISSSGVGHPSNVSPMKYRGKPKTPVPKKLNPYLPPDTDPSEWSGVVDLRDPSVLTPQRYRLGKSRHNPTTPAKNSDSDDSFDGLPPGMSPPVLMSPARPPRSSAELGLLGQTPTREASARITRDIVRDIQLKSGGQARHLYGYANSGVESSMSTMPTPPSLSRYRSHGMDSSDSLATDPSFESMMRRVGLNVPSSIPQTVSTPGLRLRPRHAANTAAPTGQGTAVETLVEPVPLPAQSHPDSDSDSDSDSFSEVNNTAHPSAAFLMASQGLTGTESDDSFGSSNHSGDSLTEEDANLGLVPVHPFAMGVEDDGFDDDDSFDDDGYGAVAEGFQEETLFGVPPVQRQEQMRGGGSLEGDQLRMLGEDLLQDTIGIGTQIAMSGRVEESPTPVSWSARG